MMMRALSGVTLSALLFAPGFAAPIDPRPAFEAADVHLSPHRLSPFMEVGVLRGDRYVLRQATMADLIANAYGVDPSYVQGGPIWLESDRFDVIAKVPSSTPPATLEVMLRSLLQDRFKLVIHNGTKPMPAFVLTTGKGALKMRQTKASGDSECKEQDRRPAPGSDPAIAFSCHQTTMETFAQNLQLWAGDSLTDPVVDSTGLKGAWDFDIEWTPKMLLPKACANGVSIFDAVVNQLGLRLEQQMAPRPVLIVDSVEQTPTANLPGLVKILPPQPPPQFDVATIKPAKAGAEFNAGISGDQVDVQNAPLRFLISFAWDLDENDQEALAGAPKWVDTDRFDISAKALSDAPGNSAVKGPRFDLEDMRLMLRALLADRFKLQAHMEGRPVWAYTLLAVNPKLRKANPLSRTRCQEGPGPDGKDPRIANPVLDQLVSCQNMTMAQIAEELQSISNGYIFRPVLDATQVKGSWDFTLSFSSVAVTRGGGGGGGVPSAGAAASDPNGALTLFDAVSKQLGLKLEKQRRPEPVLVIDHIEERPTEN
jgi:uncharacterized protein (TIGR03435 family)